HIQICPALSGPEHGSTCPDRFQAVISSNRMGGGGRCFRSHNPSLRYKRNVAFERKPTPQCGHVKWLLTAGPVCSPSSNERSRGGGRKRRQRPAGRILTGAFSDKNSISPVVTSYMAPTIAIRP